MTPEQLSWLDGIALGLVIGVVIGAVGAFNWLARPSRRWRHKPGKAEIVGTFTEGRHVRIIEEVEVSEDAQGIKWEGRLIEPPAISHDGPPFKA